MEGSKDQQRPNPFTKMLDRFRRRPTEAVSSAPIITPINEHVDDKTYSNILAETDYKEDLPKNLVQFPLNVTNIETDEARQDRETPELGSFHVPASNLRNIAQYRKSEKPSNPPKYPTSTSDLKPIK